MLMSIKFIEYYGNTLVVVYSSQSSEFLGFTEVIIQQGATVASLFKIKIIRSMESCLANTTAEAYLDEDYIYFHSDGFITAFKRGGKTQQSTD